MLLGFCLFPVRLDIFFVLLLRSSHVFSLACSLTYLPTSSTYPVARSLPQFASSLT